MKISFILILLIICFETSCTTFKTNTHKNNCLDNAIQYVNSQKELEYNAHIIIVKHNNELHAIVQMIDTELYYDPSFKVYGSDLKKFGKYRFTIKYDDINNWK